VPHAPGRRSGLLGETRCCCREVRERRAAAAHRGAREASAAVAALSPAARLARASGRARRTHAPVVKSGGVWLATPKAR